LLREAGYEFEVILPHESAEDGEAVDDLGRAHSTGPSSLPFPDMGREPAPLFHSLGGGSGESPLELVSRLARQKAGDVALRVQSGLVLGCDTVVECCGRVLGKPEDKQDARRMLNLLRGHEHGVHSGLCLWRRPDDRTRVRVATTRLRMDAIPDEQLEDYLESHQWEGKAGAFGYQDRLGWIHVIEGSESNVVGLPLELLGQMLEEYPAGSDDSDC